MFCKSICSVLFTGLLACVATAQITTTEYSSLQTEFAALHGQTIFPVSGKTTDDIESTFGPRIQASTGLYDFHRGFDVDGTQGDDILAIKDGVFWEHRVFDRGGLTVIMRHDFSSPMSLNGNSYDHYFTYYLHLFDDNVAGNGVGTLDVIDGWVAEKTNPGMGTAIGAGDHIAEMGNSGSSGGLPYADHLHVDLRVGANASLIFQLDNPDTTQHGFDPHLHPMLLFEPPVFGGDDNSPMLSSSDDLDHSSDFRITYENSDLAVLLNRLEFTILDAESNTLLDSHVLDFNLRTGFDASDLTALDTQDVLFPYINPLPFGDSAASYQTEIVIPEVWLNAASDQFILKVEAFDIWGNATELELTSIPEPRLAGLLAALLLPCIAVSRRRIGQPL